MYKVNYSEGVDYSWLCISDGVVKPLIVTIAVGVVLHEKSVCVHLL